MTGSFSCSPTYPASHLVQKGQCLFLDPLCKNQTHDAEAIRLPTFLQSVQTHGLFLNSTSNDINTINRMKSEFVLPLEELSTKSRDLEGR